MKNLCKLLDRFMVAFLALSLLMLFGFGGFMTAGQCEAKELPAITFDATVAYETQVDAQELANDVPTVGRFAMYDVGKLQQASEPDELRQAKDRDEDLIACLPLRILRRTGKALRSAVGRCSISDDKIGVYLEQLNR